MMKRMMKLAVFALFALVVVVHCSCAAVAAGVVTYDGNAREFIFTPGTDRSPTDLFEDFKDIMPGDTITQQIVIRNDVSNKSKVKLYIRALGAQEDSEDFLRQLRLTVAQDGDSILFDAPADETAQLTDWVCLGTFYSGAEIKLNTTLEVPVELENDFQNAVGYLDWEFRIEEFPIGEGDPSIPETSDTSNFLRWVILMLTSAAAIAAMVAVFRKRTAE